MPSGLIAGPGIGLQLPQSLYPSQVQNAPYDMPTNRVGLNAGDTFLVPAGRWFIHIGMYCVLQYQDPVTGVWVMSSTAGWNGGVLTVESDGFTLRIANLLGCPVHAVVAVQGSGYAQATTTVTPTPGNSTWQPIVGGALALVGATLTSNGAGYGIAPIALIPAPPPAANNPNGVGGVQATGYCTIASGTVSGFTFTNPGAGYPTAPTPVIVPSPFDPNINTGITAAVMAFSLTGAGALTGCLCTNPGAPLSNPNQITLTVTGAGSSGSLTACSLQTVTAGSVSGVGTGFGTVSALLTTVGGVPPSGSISNNPDALGLAWRPRPAQIGLAVTGVGSIGTQVGTIYDGGLFLTNSAPNYIIGFQPTSQTGTIVAPTLALTMGSRPDFVTLQPAP